MHSLCTHYPPAPLTGELQQSFDMQLFVTKQSGGVGVDNSLAESAMALLSTFSVNSHVSMTVMGIIPTIKSSEVSGMPCGGVSATFPRPRWLNPRLASLSERPTLSFSSRVARLQWPQKQQQTRDVLHACSSGLSPPSLLPRRVRYSLSTFADKDPMKTLSKLANSTAADNLSMKQQADVARTGADLAAMKSAETSSVISSLSKIDGEKNQMLDINTMVL